MSKDVDGLIKQLLSLRNCNPSQYSNRLAQELSEKTFQAHLPRYAIVLAALRKIEPDHVLFEPAYARFLTTSQWDVNTYQAGGIVYALTKINAATLCDDLKSWFATAKTPNPQLLYALTQAAHNNRHDVVEFLLSARVWSTRAIASLIPIALKKDRNFAHQLLNHPILQNNKDDILFCILSKVGEDMPLWNLMFSDIIPYLSANNIIESLNSYQKYANNLQKISDNFISDLRALAEKDMLMKAVMDEIDASASPIAKRKM